MISSINIQNSEACSRDAFTNLTSSKTRKIYSFCHIRTWSTNGEDPNLSKIKEPLIRALKSIYDVHSKV